MLKTLPAIARASGFQSHQVKHVVRTRRIEHTARIGVMGARLYDDKTARKIVKALKLSARRPPEVPRHAASPTDNQRTT